MLIFKLTEYSNVESFALLLHFSFSLTTSSHSISESLLSLAHLVVLFCLLSAPVFGYLVFSLPHNPGNPPSEIAPGPDSDSQPRTQGLLLGGEDV